MKQMILSSGHEFALRRPSVFAVSCALLRLWQACRAAVGSVGCAAGLGLAWGLHAVEPAINSPKPLYENNFEQCALDQLPADLMVLEGAWTVKQDGGNRFLELPGSPTDGFAVLFGPPVGEGTAVSARIYGTNQKKRLPAFGVGLGGAGGYRLVVSAGKKLLELYKAEERLATAPCVWESGTWTHLLLAVRKTGAEDWKVEGKAWKDGAAEPAAWQISYTEKTAPSPGKCAVWGYPYAGTPLRFDDLKIVALGKQ